MKKLLFLIFLFYSLIGSFSLYGAVSLPSVISNGMVLQQNSEVSLWGWAKPNEMVAISPGWSKQTVTVRADMNARWKATLVTPSAGGPYNITFKASNFIVVSDVLIGEVWLCSGESNMEWSASNGVINSDSVIAAANDPQLRFFSVAQTTADCAQNDCNGIWSNCTPHTMKDFSAVAYFFGSQLRQSLKVPVALIHASWSGSNIETWMDPYWIESKPFLFSSASKIPDSEWNPTKPGKTFFSMIAPLIPYRIAGMLWYQGENNLFNADSYAEMLSAMVDGYRAKWGYVFAFYYAQIAPYQYDQPMAGALIRDEQRQALSSLSHSGMVVLSDVADVMDIQPKNKSIVGDRFASMALNRLYGFDNFPDSGPMFRSLKVEGSRLRVTFDYADDGMYLIGKELNDIYVAGADRIYYKAKAKIDGNSILVWTGNVKFPVAVRYAFGNTQSGNLFNVDGLPASSFRTDNWPLVY